MKQRRTPKGKFAILLPPGKKEGGQKTTRQKPRNYNLGSKAGGGNSGHGMPPGLGSAHTYQGGGGTAWCDIKE